MIMIKKIIILLSLISLTVSLLFSFSYINEGNEECCTWDYYLPFEHPTSNMIEHNEKLLNEIVAYLEQNKISHVRIELYLENRGSYKMNLILGETITNFIKKYIIDKASSIGEERISTKAYIIDDVRKFNEDKNYYFRLCKIKE